MYALIAEDNELQSKVLAALLKDEDITAIIAEDGGVALKLLETQKVDIIISDVYMPRVDGMTLLYIVKRDEKFKKIPFVMYSSKPIDSDIGLAYDLKVDHFVEEQGIVGVLPAVKAVLQLNKPK